MQIGEKKVYEKISEYCNIVFDVGSREDLDYYNIKKNCEYHLFEPNLEFTKVLEQKLSNEKKHNVIINQFGLSDFESENAIYYKNTQSFVKHWQGLSIDSGDKYTLKKLDNYVKEKNIKKIDFIKTDCEELDEKVILGGIETIKEKNKVSFVQLEYSTIKTFVDLLENFKFTLIIEPEWLRLVNTIDTKNFKFNNLLIELEDDMIHFLDTDIKSKGWGGNIFGINKNLDFNNIIKNVNDIKLDYLS
jgi:FkbM family methyltransferase